MFGFIQHKNLENLKNGAKYMSMYVWFHTTQNLENLKNGAKYMSMYVWFHTT